MMRLKELQVFARQGAVAVGLALAASVADDILRKFRSREWKVRDEPILMGTTEDGVDYAINLEEVFCITVKPLPENHAAYQLQQAKQGAQLTQPNPQYPHGPWRASGRG